MSFHLKVFNNGAGRVFVVVHPECAIERESILALLIAAGFDPASVSFLSPDEAADEVAIGEECTIIPVDANVTDAPELDEAARCRAQNGRVVVVFAEGFAPEGLHPIASKYGSQCGWSPAALREQVGSNPAEVLPEDSSGAPIGRSRSNPVNC